jgi:hypothetical protein
MQLLKHLLSFCQSFSVEDLFPLKQGIYAYVFFTFRLHSAHFDPLLAFFLGVKNLVMKLRVGVVIISGLLCLFEKVKRLRHFVGIPKAAHELLGHFEGEVVLILQ